MLSPAARALEQFFWALVVWHVFFLACLVCVAFILVFLGIHFSFFF